MVNDFSDQGRKLRKNQRHLRLMSIMSQIEEEIFYFLLLIYCKNKFQYGQGK